jgi:hypothetical protein
VSSLVALASLLAVSRSSSTTEQLSSKAASLEGSSSELAAAVSSGFEEVILEDIASLSRSVVHCVRDEIS